MEKSSLTIFLIHLIISRTSIIFPNKYNFRHAEIFGQSDPRETEEESY